MGSWIRLIAPISVLRFHEERERGRRDWQNHTCWAAWWHATVGSSQSQVAMTDTLTLAAIISQTHVPQSAQIPKIALHGPIVFQSGCMNLPESSRPIRPGRGTWSTYSPTSVPRCRAADASWTNRRPSRNSTGTSRLRVADWGFVLILFFLRQLM